MKKNYLIIAGISILLVLGGLGYWYYGERFLTPKNSDPLALVTVPSNLDEATRTLYEEKLEGTKKMYQEMPNIWETWVAIGNIKSLFGDYQGALAAYEKSVTLQPNNIVAQRNIAVLYNNQLNDPERAAAHYQLAIDNEPGDVELYGDLAMIQFKRLNRPSDAEATLLQALNRGRSKRDSLSRLVRFYEETNNQEKYQQYKTMLEAEK